MQKVDIITGTGYYDIDMFIEFNHLILDVLYFTEEHVCPSAEIHTKYYWELNYFCNGSGTIHSDGQSYKIEDHTYTLIPPQHSYRIEVDDNNPPEKYVIGFTHDKGAHNKIHSYTRMYQADCNVLDSIITKNETTVTYDFEKTKFNVNSGSINVFKNIVKDFAAHFYIASEYISPTTHKVAAQELLPRDIGAQMKLKLRFSEIFTDLILSYHDGSTYEHSDISPITKYWMQYRIMSIMDTQYKGLTLAGMAKDLSISQRQLHRYMMDCYGKTFTQKLTETRMYFAKTLLIDTDMSVSEVSNEVGIKSESYFRKKFKELNGQSPEQFRAANK